MFNIQILSLNVEERINDFVTKVPNVSGYLKKYASMVTSENTGAVLKVK